MCWITSRAPEYPTNQRIAMAIRVNLKIRLSVAFMVAVDLISSAHAQLKG